MSRLRILVLGPDCNPEGISIPYVTYSHAAALTQNHDVSLVIRSTVEDRVCRAKAPFRSIEVVRMPALEKAYAWVFKNIFRSNLASQAVTAFGYPFALAFEWFAWRQLRERIFAGEFDVVLFLTLNPFEWPFPNLLSLFPQLRPFGWYAPAFWSLVAVIVVARAAYFSPDVFSSFDRLAALTARASGLF